MKLLARAWRAIRAPFARKSRETDLEVEVRLTSTSRRRPTCAAGWRPEEARRAALVSFGGLDQAKEDCRESWARPLPRGARPGRPLRPARPAPQPRVHGGRGGHPRPRHRRQHRGLQPRERRAAQAPALRARRAARGRAPAGQARGPARPRVLPARSQATTASMARTLDGFVEYHSMDFTLLGGGDPRRVRTGVVSCELLRRAGGAAGPRPLLPVRRRDGGRGRGPHPEPRLLARARRRPRRSWAGASR